MATRSMADLSGQVQHGCADTVRLPHLHSDRVRRTIGAALARLAVSRKQFAAALHLHHSQASRRLSGSGPLPNAGVELAQMELAEIPTDTIFDALRKVALEARAMVRPAVRCIRSLVHRKSCADIEEDRARADYHAGVAGARERLIDTLTAEIREAEELLQALLGEGSVAR